MYVDGRYREVGDFKAMRDDEEDVAMRLWFWDAGQGIQTDDDIRCATMVGAR